MGRYYLGIDGGGSNTIMALSDGENIIFQESFPASNYHNVGIENVKEVFANALETFYKKCNVHWTTIDAICFGGAGIDTSEDEAKITQVIRDLGYTGKLAVINDSVTALVGANGKKEGAVLICGTGSIALGVLNNELIRVGGWGHIIGDEGSGYSIARDAFKAVSKSCDGRASQTQLWEAMKLEYGFSHPDEIIGFLYGDKSGKDQVARLTPKVIDLYDVDLMAKVIVDENIREIAEMVLALSRKMQSETFLLSVTGSVLTKSDCYFELFKSHVQLDLPKVTIQRAENHPVIGALIIAKSL